MHIICGALHLCAFHLYSSCLKFSFITDKNKYVLWQIFHSWVKEGDGLRVLRCYRYLLPIFKSSRRSNYSIEILNFLVQHDYSLSERQAAELVWSRFINTRGQPGKNIPNDLHCEHLNRLCKTAVRGLMANKTPECITRVARAIGTSGA